MNYKDRIENSDIILSGLKSKDITIKSTKARVVGIIFSVLLIVFTIISVVVKIPKIEKTAVESSELSFDELVIVISILAISSKIILSVIMAYIKRSLFKLNHMKAFDLVEILLHLNLAFIIFANIYNYYTIVEINKLWEGAGSFADNFKEIFLKTPTNMLIIIGILLIDLPAFLIFMFHVLKNSFTFFMSIVLTIIFPVTLVLYLLKNNRIFYEYVDYNQDYYQINKRYIKKENYGMLVYIRKIIVLIALAGFFFLFMLASHDVFHVEMTVGLFFKEYFPYIVFYCYTVSLLYALEWRMDRLVVRLSKNYIEQEEERDE